MLNLLMLIFKFTEYRKDRAIERQTHFLRGEAERLLLGLFSLEKNKALLPSSKEALERAYKKDEDKLFSLL